jgi:hypothetical protein
MTPECIFTQALGLVSPWKVVSANFDAAAKSLELVIDFIPGSRMPSWPRDEAVVSLDFELLL